VGKLLTAGAATVLLWAAACSSADDPPPRDESSGTTAEAPGPTDAGDATDSTDADADADADGGPGPDEPGDADADEVLGSATARLRADPNDGTPVPLRLDVTALERLEGRVEVRLVLTNEGTGTSPSFKPYSTFDDPRLSAGQGQYSLAGAALVDGEAKKSYLAIIDSEGTCLCTGDLAEVEVPPGESVDLYADFGGVPDDAERIDVSVPGFPPVTQVPIAS
jgi:hypothetical protein